MESSFLRISDYCGLSKKNYVYYEDMHVQQLS